MGARLIFDTGTAMCWLIDGEYYVYGLTGDPRVCPSLGMAHEIAAGL